MLSPQITASLARTGRSVGALSATTSSTIMAARKVSLQNNIPSHLAGVLRSAVIFFFPSLISCEQTNSRKGSLRSTATLSRLTTRCGRTPRRTAALKSRRRISGSIRWAHHPRRCLRCPVILRNKVKMCCVPHLRGVDVHFIKSSSQLARPWPDLHFFACLHPTGSSVWNSSL